MCGLCNVIYKGKVFDEFIVLFVNYIEKVIFVCMSCCFYEFFIIVIVEQNKFIVVREILCVVRCMLIELFNFISGCIYIYLFGSIKVILILWVVVFGGVFLCILRSGVICIYDDSVSFNIEVCILLWCVIIVVLSFNYFVVFIFWLCCYFV